VCGSPCRARFRRLELRAEARARASTRPRRVGARFDAAGHPADTTDLKHDVCTWLANLQHQPAPQAALAVEALTHESGHLVGYADESVAHCRALQLMGWTAEQLGATPQARAWTAISVERTPYMPPEYYDPTCPAFRAQTTNPSPQ
jgi:hypothetical protein